MSDFDAIQPTDLPRVDKISKKKAEKDRDDQRIRKFITEQLMSSHEGRRYVWLELTSGNVFSQTFVRGEPDATAFQEGQRSKALSLLADVTRWTPGGYVTMTTENASVKIEEQDDATPSPD